MSPSAEYKTYVLDLIEPIIPLTTTRFFGGVGLTYNAVQFGMMIGNNLYFVVDDTTRNKYLQAGMQAFSYLSKKGRVQVRRYYELPEEILTDAVQLRLWALEAINIASQTKKKQ
ncbi:MAG TPA: TfoX/Sxy family protein [Methylotenera sp.]|nr:TfoX/Sxy family protein [Methylotenera sp.]HPH04571.1 TfoX/Sxy family protein [Methylotenera sp.]HPN00754.1 TfoX/Sxy family protein [Methylotenera sp.]